MFCAAKRKTLSRNLVLVKAGKALSIPFRFQGRTVLPGYFRRSFGLQKNNLIKSFFSPPSMFLVQRKLCEEKVTKFEQRSQNRFVCRESEDEFRRKESVFQTEMWFLFMLFSGVTSLHPSPPPKKNQKKTCSNWTGFEILAVTTIVTLCK